MNTIDIDQFLDNSSGEPIDTMEGVQDALPFGSAENDQLQLNANSPSGQPAKRLRNRDINFFDNVPEQRQSQELCVLRKQTEIQKKLYDAVAKSLEENKELAKSMQYNTRRMYEALERLSVGSLELVRATEAQNIEEARHNKVMEHIAKEELKINQKLLELKLKRETLRTP